MWASPFACSLDLPTTPSYSLTSTRAPTATHGLAFPRIAPESKPRRPYHHYLAAGHRRSPLRPHLCHQSSSGEHPGCPVPFVDQVRPAIAVSELSPGQRGTSVRIWILLGPLCKPRGIFVKFQIFLRAAEQIDSWVLYLLVQWLAKIIENRRNILKLQNQFCCTPGDKTYNFCKACICFWAIVLHEKLKCILPRSLYFQIHTCSWDDLSICCEY
jgi:hypothetical protein